MALEIVDNGQGGLTRHCSVQASLVLTGITSLGCVYGQFDRAFKWVYSKMFVNNRRSHFQDKVGNNKAGSLICITLNAFLEILEYIFLSLFNNKIAQIIFLVENHLLCMPYIKGILPKGPYLPCLRMAGRALLARYPQYVDALQMLQWVSVPDSHYIMINNHTVIDFLKIIIYQSTLKKQMGSLKIVKNLSRYYMWSEFN